MKTQFQGYYSGFSSAIDLKSEQCIVAFDANVLLNLYRYPSSAAEDILKVMEALGQRVWLPHQAAFEYQRNRLGVIADQNKKFRDVRKIAEDGIRDIQKNIDSLQLRKRHSTIDPAEYLARLQEATVAFLNTLKTQEDSFPDVVDTDLLRDKIDRIFTNRIGPSPENQEWLDKIFSEGAKRFAAKIPPGYRDQSKKGETASHRGLIYQREYGDLILWKQLIQQCKDNGIRQVVFVTDDDKEDWWLSVDSGGSKRIGPRPELTEELAIEASVEHFVMLSSERFVQKIATELNLQFEATTLQQVTDVKATLTTQEQVKCPYCGVVGQVTLGVAAASSAVNYCDGCGSRSHVHRRRDGQVLTKEWGSPRISSTSRFRVEATCPKCSESVPANFTNGEDKVERYCMNCCSLLTIDASGNVISSNSASPQPAASVVHEGRFTLLGCPVCSDHNPIRTIWGNSEIERAVCPVCRTLIEATTGE